MTRRWQHLFFVFALMIGLGITTPFVATAYAAIDVYEFDNPQQEAQYRGLIDEFRCPKCQNQNLAGSDSQIAQDLKRKTYRMVMAGQTDAQIRDYMSERYGDFISYKPPVRPTTWILWFFPPLALITLVGWWLWRGRQQSQQRQAVVSGGAEMTKDTVINNELSHLSVQEQQQLDSLLTKYGHQQQKMSNESPDK